MKPIRLSLVLFAWPLASWAADPAPAIPPTIPVIPAPVLTQTTAPTVAAVMPYKPDATEMQLIAPDSIPSLLYSPTEAKKIRQAQADYRRQGAPPVAEPANPGQSLPDLNALPAQQVVRYYPQFYLSSIVYHTPEDWTIWVSGKKITPTKPNPELHVERIDKDSARLIWKPKDPADGADIWNKQPPEGIVMDRTARQIAFTLHPNQTLVLHDMKITEGIKPRKIIPPEAINPDAPQGVDMSKQGGKTVDDLAKLYQSNSSTSPNASPAPMPPVKP